MPTINSNDIFLVQRGSNTYKLNAEDLMSTILDTDYLLINRGSNSYKVTGADVKGQLGGPPGSTKVVSSGTRVSPLYGASDPSNAAIYYLNYQHWPPHEYCGQGWDSAFSAPWNEPLQHAGTNIGNYVIVEIAWTEYFTNYPITGTLEIFLDPYADQFGWRNQTTMTATANTGQSGSAPGDQYNKPSKITITGLSNTTSISFSATNSIHPNYAPSKLAIYGYRINGQACVWGEDRQSVTVENASGFSNGDCVASAGANGGSGRVMSKNGNTLYLYQVNGSFASGDTVLKMNSNALPAANKIMYGSPLQAGASHCQYQGVNGSEPVPPIP